LERCFRPAEQTGEHVGTLVVGAGQSGDESNEPSQFVSPFGGFSAPWSAPAGVARRKCRSGST